MTDHALVVDEGSSWQAGEKQAHELGAFLRSRRESLDPQRLGVVQYGRRRTPGLRREDVAQLADIGVTWYTKLEQGRPVRASAKVLKAIAAALQCDDSETQYLFALAGMGKPATTPQTDCEGLCHFAAKRILDELNPLPAIVQNARFDIIGHNASYCRLLGIDLETIAPEERNCLYQPLVNPEWRARIANWEEVLPRAVALFRAAMAGRRDDPLWEARLQRLMAVSEEFRTEWLRNSVRGVENQHKQFQIPGHGLLAMYQVNWWSAPRDGARMLVYVPADEINEQKWRRIAEGG